MVPYLQRPEVLLVRVILAVATQDFAAVQSPHTRQRMVEELVSFCRVSLSFSMDDKESPQERMSEAVRHIVHDPSALTSFFEGQILRNTEPGLAHQLRLAVAAAQDSDAPNSFARMLDALDMPRWATAHWVETQRRIDAVAHLDGLRTAAAQVGSAKAFFAALNRAETELDALNAGTGAKRGAAAKALKAVKTTSLCLADIASVKGLEFEHVIMPFLARGEFPCGEGNTPHDERNLFYVGITRARSALTLFAHAHAPSSFVQEIGP
jgi:DNA helicase II / ATP-dependent DNA helicase PcrA